MGYTDAPTVRWNQEVQLMQAEIAAESRTAVHTLNLVTAVRCCGPIDVEALRAAITSVCNRHELLRSVFVKAEACGGEARKARLQTWLRTGLGAPGLYECRPLESVQVPLERQRLRFTNDDIRSPVAAAVEPLALTPFDCAQPPLLRALLLSSSHDDHVLVGIVPHVVADKRSLEIIRDDIIDTYRRGSDDIAADDGVAAKSFQTFVEDEAGRIASGAFHTEVAYWRRHWERQGLHHLRLPEHTLRRSRSAPYAVAELRLSSDRATAIHAFVREAEVTTQIFFRACFAAALTSLSGGSATAHWCAFANRGPGTRRTVGWFSHRHALAPEIPADASWLDVLGQTRTAIAHAMTHQAMPLHVLWAHLGKNVERESVSLHVSLDVDVRHRSTTVDGRDIAPLDLPRGRWPRAADIDVRVSGMPSGIVVVVKFRSPAVPTELIHRLLATFDHCTDRMVSAPEENVADGRGRCRLSGTSGAQIGALL